MMTSQEFKDLLSRYTQGEATEEEQQLVERFYEKTQETEQGWEAFSKERKETLRLEMYRAIQQKKQAKKRKIVRLSHSILWKVAATVLIILAVGIGITYYFSVPKLDEPVVAYLTKKTEAGQKASITLSDGTVVRLNAESAITFPESFKATDSRTVELKGEAFFEVKHLANQPFTIRTGEVHTTVLGTTFNVNAYDTTAVAVALVSGKVRVHLPSSNTVRNTAEVLLSPGELARYNPTNRQIGVSDFDEKSTLAWKDNVLYFDSANHEQVFKQLARWYGVQFEFTNAPAEPWAYSGEFKDMSLELVLNTISYSKGFKYHIEHKKVTITFNQS